MPVTEAIKPPVGGRRKTVDNGVDNLSKKRSGRIKETSEENQLQGDEVPAPVVANNKKTVAKKAVADNSEKKVKTPLSDKVPKKTVQRAKGSMALNKTIDPEDKKKLLCEMEEMNHNSTTVIKENPDHPKVKAVGSKPRQSIKSNRPGSEKRITSGKTKNWTTVVKKKSNTTATLTEDAPTKPGEIQRDTALLSSCSFFEKLQQGVKAYFASRNSLIDEKSKKKVTEGGIRTGAGVAKGGKEETKARTQDNKIINKIKYSDIHLFYDRPRLKSNSEGQMNNFLNKKPKILQYVKRKKLYHPKNKNNTKTNCVRIQIPRKGYFYRSFEFRPKQSATSPRNRRLESTSLSTKPEIQIARMASTGPKISDIHKKRLEKWRKKSSSVKRNSDEYLLVYNYLEAINFVLKNQMVAHNFEKEVNRIALKWPTEAMLSSKDINLLSNEEKSIGEQLDSEGDKKSCKSTENLLNSSNTEIQQQDDCIQIESCESYSILEAQIQNSKSNCKTPQQSKFKPDPSFDILMQCLRKSLGEEESYGALEISSVTRIKGSTESDFICETTLPKYENASSIGKSSESPLRECKSPLQLEKSEEKYAKILIGDIDLHSELQNYLKKTKKGRKHDKDSVPILCQNDQIFGLSERESFSSKRSFDSCCDPPFNRNSEIKSLSEEILNVRSNPSQILPLTRSSESLSSSATNGLKKTSSKELSLKSVKGTHKKTSSPLMHSNANEKLVSYLVSLLFKKHNEQLSGALDCYERVSPMGTAIGAKANKSKLLHSNSMNSMFTEQNTSRMRNTKSESSKFQRHEDFEGDQKIRAVEDADENQIQNCGKWCPTLDELVDIYSCILKQSSKKKSSIMTENSWISSIMSTIKDKLNEKQNKINLINLTKTLRACFKPPSDWTPGTESNREKKLQEYVNMFQEILLSSLSIEQISYLNSAISQLQEEKESPSEFSKYQNNWEENSSSDDKIDLENETSSSPVATPQEDAKKGKPETVENTSTSVQSKNFINNKSSLRTIKPVKKPVKVEVSPPTALEKVLKSTLNSENVRKKSKTVNKILVNVKFSGSQVLVNDFSFIRDERFLRARPPTQNKVSELIIENITSNRLIETSSDLNITPSTHRKNSKKSIQANRNIKIVVKSSKLKNQKSRRRLKIVPEDLDYSNKENSIDDIKTSLAAQECKKVTSAETVSPKEHVILKKSKKSFEYDQQQLKAQHPINAIVETSESKIMESVESNESIEPYKKSLAKTKILEAKDPLNKSTAYRLFSKVLLRDLGWSNYGSQKDLVRTKSHNLNLHRSDDSDLKKGSMDNVKFLDDLQFHPRSGEKKNKKVPVRQQNTYFCYPSLVLKEESAKKNKKTKEPDFKSIKSTSSKVIKKTDSRVIKKTSLKGMKKSDLKPVKTTATSKGTKQQVDSKGIGKANSKVVKKKDLKEVAKKPDKLPTFSSQVAASERLAKRPERFCRPVQVPPKPKDVQSTKTSINKGFNVKTPKISQDSILYIKKTSDFGSESSSFNASTGSSYYEEVTKQKQKSQSENFNKSTSSSEAADSVDKYKNVPVVIYSTSDDSDCVTSQFAIIRSDSILKTLSRSPISLNKINSVFKSHSDFKFYPGRIPDSGEEQQPWVTFILTPQQQAKAELPDYQVKIVDKHSFVEEEEKEIENEQIPLNSIEKFIDELKESRIKIMRQQKESEKWKNGRKKLSSAALVKQNIKWPSCEPSKNMTDYDYKNNKMNNVLEESDKDEKCNSEKETVLAKVVVSILQFLLNQRDKETDQKPFGSNGQQFEEISEIENLQPELSDGANGDIGEKWQVIEKTTSQMLNTVINEVTKSEKLVEKEKLILAIKDELEERKTDPEANVDGLLELSKKIEAIKSLEKLKIQTSKNDSLEELEKENMFFPILPKKKKTEESLFSVEEETNGLERKISIYFDAEDKFKDDLEECAYRSEYSSEEHFPWTVSEHPGEGEAEPESSKKTYSKGSKETYSKGLFSASDENLFSMKMVNLKSEEIIINKIYENLRKNNVFYSVVLFDKLLKEKDLLVKDKKVQSDVQTANQKGQNITVDVEKNAWMKLDLLLEEVSKVYDVQSEEESSDESVYHCIMHQLNKTLAFLSNIRVINTKMADLQNFMSQSKICSDFDLNTFLSRFLTRLNQLKKTVIPKLTRSMTRFFEDENFKNRSGCEIHAVKADHNFNIVDDLSKESQLQYLKNQIKDQRLFIEFLINTSSSSTSSEIDEIKKKVSEKIKLLEKSMSSKAKGEDVKNKSQESLLTSLLPLSQTSSILSLTKACRSLGIAKRIRLNVKPWK